ncbi:MAG: hypothetical protein MR911_02865 [Spirochaetia bacterium]|nr:hypothetical protein [Spirochaetia bacterium]
MNLLEEIKERIKNLPDDQLLKEGITCISDYREDVQILYKDEIEKRNFSHEIIENYIPKEKETIVVERVNHTIEKTEKEIMEKVPEIPEEEILYKFFEKYQILDYVNEFKNQKVFSLEILKDLTDDDLLKLGVITLGDRKRLLKLFQGNELNNFRNLLLYKNVDKNELEKIDIEENEILKHNKCKFKYMSADAEKGELTLYCNRIVWKGYLNEFTIAIIDITDVSVKSMAGQSTLIITANEQIFNFTFINSATGTSAALAAFAGLSDAAVVGVAMMNDKPITDIEFWRQKIESLREEQKQSPNNFGISHGKIDIKTSNEMKGCMTVIILIVVASVIGYFIWLSNQFPF